MTPNQLKELGINEKDFTDLGNHWVALYTSRTGDESCLLTTVNGGIAAFENLIDLQDLIPELLAKKLNKHPDEIDNETIKHCVCPGHIPAQPGTSQKAVH
ncbi:MAG: hypothetical protein KGI60_01785 [Patescibacteria group bacterium]|nr:hypothetical protein [Patescibacteria group bacterium]